MNILHKFRSKKVDLPLAITLSVAFILRFVSLGYSDFQGDEIKALFLPDGSTSISEFLLTQRKGPIQFLVTFLVKLIDPLYTNQFLVRLPFAIAGFLAVYYFYKLIKYHFNEKIAFYSSLLLATSGFFVAFSRITQYQSFVILFSVLCLYSLTIAVHNPKMKIKGLYLSMFFWALSILSHYDGVFILPAVLMLLVQWVKNSDLSFKPKAKTVTLSFALFAALNLLFYIPFALYLSQDTKDYWSGRLVGNASSKISSSYYLFSVYHPIYVIHFYLAFFATAVSVLLLALSPSLVEKLFSKIFLIKSFFSVAKNMLIKEIGLAKIFTLIFWFALPFMFWELVVYIPGTHIYTYLLPTFVILAIGISFLEEVWLTLTNKIRIIKPVLIKNILLCTVFTFLALQSYFVFVDSSVEYPWQQEKFLLWTMHTPNATYHLSLFGFPYFRDWESIAEFVSRYPNVSAYSTNERESIARHYVNLQKDTDKAGFYIFLQFPQSFTEHILNEKALYWASNYAPVYTLSRGGMDLVNIYNMSPGTLAEIQAKGL